MDGVAKIEMFDDRGRVGGTVVHVVYAAPQLDYFGKFSAIISNTSPPCP